MLDRVDINMARVAVAWYIRAHHLHKRPVPAAAYRLADHLEDAVSANGPECVVPEPDWMTTGEVAARLKCSTRHARRIAERIGKRVGRQWLIPPDALPDEE